LQYSKLSNIVNDIINILVPQVCFGCMTPLGKGERLLCTFCRNQLPLTEYNFIDENPIDRIFYGIVPIEKANSLLFFTPNLKYKNQQEIGDFLGDWLGHSINEKNPTFSIDYVIPVPLHKKKLKKRGYNQVTTFGQRLAKHLDATYVDHILIKTANTKTQTKKNRFFRRQNSQALYKVLDTSFLQHKNVLLIDDVITTGATLEACSIALKEAEGVKIYIATMAVVP
jgi:competence protein ComFC